MSKSLFKRVVVSTVVVVVVVCSAYVIGVQAGKYYSNKKLIKNRELQTQSYLKQTNLSVGKQIINHSFENLEFESVVLSTLIKKRTMLVFIIPDCNSCVEDIKLLKDNVSETESVDQFILVSSENPRNLMDMRDEMELEFLILYDHDRYFTSMFKINSYPFHIIIDEKMILEEIIVSKLVEDDLIEFMQ